MILGVMSVSTFKVNLDVLKAMLKHDLLDETATSDQMRPVKMSHQFCISPFSERPHATTVKLGRDNFPMHFLENEQKVPVSRTLTIHPLLLAITIPSVD